MPMSPCTRCLESQWSYAHAEGIVTATCKLCGHEVSWQTAKAKRAADPKVRAYHARVASEVEAKMAAFAADPEFHTEEPPWD